jgi:hypothetical protein
LALSPHDAGQTAQRDLLSILQPTGKFGRGMFRTVHGIDFTTRPYGTEFQGVCQMDNLTLRYGPVPPDPKIRTAKPAMEDMPRRPYGIDAQAVFHIDMLPAGTLLEDAGGVWQASCDPSRLGDDAHWFRAKNATDAVRAANMFRMAENEVKSGAIRPEPCPDVFKGQTCRQAILAVEDLAKLNDVEACDAAPGRACFRLTLDAGMTELTIIATLNGDGGNVTPTAITAIEVRQYVVVT